MGQDELINIKSLVKIYPPSTLAVDSVSLTIKRGKIHSIIGENGAGKSTLMKVLYGLIPYNNGDIFFRGEKVNFNSPKEAVKAGIGMVHQEFMLIPSYTVFENVILGTEPTGRFGILREKKARNKIKSLIEEYNLNLDIDSTIEDISVAARQKVEILKLLYKDVDVLILDEPTAVLTPQEIEELFDRLKKLKTMGKTIIFISHKLAEVLELSDTITVMRKGKKITTLENKNLTKSQLAKAMVGREVVFSVKKGEARPGKNVLEVKNLSYKDDIGYKLKELAFNVRKGEIVGVAGVEGNGQFELVHCITGLINAYHGEIWIDGQNINGKNILERRKLMAYVSQDRKDMGSAQKLDLIDNSIMSHHRINGMLSGGGWDTLLSNKASNRLTHDIVNRYQVVAPGVSSEISSLSGGNQQRLIVGREFTLDTNFVLLDQPTRGVDVGSIEFIQEEIIRKRDSGVGILLISADLDELFSLSDRLLILYQGMFVADTDPKNIDKEEVGEYMLGAKGVVKQ